MRSVQSIRAAVCSVQAMKMIAATFQNDHGGRR
jgi:hypothetical protein